jgi:hypothetical protein
MCNGWNHPFDCTCGWGGVGHLGKRSAGPPTERFSSRADHVTPKEYGTRDSYTIPNAKCPVCDAKVYFYRSPDNGRVFFDELGPPWPKHTCTTSSLPRYSRVAARQKPRDFLPSKLAWEREGWTPLMVHEISAIPSAIEWCRIKGSYQGRGRDLFARSDEVPRHTLFHARDLGGDKFEVSYFLIREDQQIVVREFIAFAKIPDTRSTQISKQMPSSGESAGPMVDALRKAGLNKE